MIVGCSNVIVTLLMLFIADYSRWISSQDVSVALVGPLFPFSWFSGGCVCLGSCFHGFSSCVLLDFRGWGLLVLCVVVDGFCLGVAFTSGGGECLQSYMLYWALHGLLMTWNSWSQMIESVFIDRIDTVYIVSLVNVCYWFLIYHKKFNSPLFKRQSIFHAILMTPCACARNCIVLLSCSKKDIKN